MIRALLLIVLPIALPLLIYIGYLKFITRRAAESGAEPTEVEQRTRQRILLLVALATAVMAAVAFTTLRLSEGAPLGVKVQAQRLIDGKIEPSHPVE